MKSTTSKHRNLAWKIVFPPAGAVRRWKLVRGFLGAERWNSFWGSAAGPEWHGGPGYVTLVYDGVMVWGDFSDSASYLASWNKFPESSWLARCAVDSEGIALIASLLSLSLLPLWTWIADPVKRLRCWLCWATRAGRAPITLMCLFMFAHCWAAHRLVSQVYAAAHVWRGSASDSRGDFLWQDDKERWRTQSRLSQETSWIWIHVEITQWNESWHLFTEPGQQ